MEVPCILVECNLQDYFHLNGLLFNKWNANLIRSSATGTIDVLQRGIVTIDLLIVKMNMGKVALAEHISRVRSLQQALPIIGSSSAFRQADFSRAQELALNAYVYLQTPYVDEFISCIQDAGSGRPFYALSRPKANFK